jgi:ABC-2 type transport system permease protein
MRQALHAEWTKLRTVQSNSWLLIATVVLTVGVSAAVSAGVQCPSLHCDEDATKVSLTGIMLGQATVAALAVLMMTSEYGTGMIRVTLTAMPRRSVVLAAKAVIGGAAALVVGTIAVLGCLLVGRLILPGNGFTAVHGYAALSSLGNGPTLRAAVGSVLYLVLIALFSLGIASALRDSAVAVTVVLGLLYIFPIIGHVILDPVWQTRISQIAPMSAGLAIQATINLRGLPIGPWQGIGVLAAYAAGAVLAGWVVLRLRDA